MVPTSSPINTALFLICTMSPTAKNGIETESYRQTVDPDEATDQHILESAFFNMVKDLEASGLVLDIEWNDVFEDQETLFKFLNLVSYLLPNTLYAHLKADSRLKDCLGHILDGSLGDEETLVQTYLSELGGLDGQDPLLPELGEEINRYYSSISQTDVFTDYMRNLYNLIMGERFATEFDAEAHTVYRNTIRDMVTRFSTVVNAFEHHPEFEKLCRIQSQIILDIVAPANFSAYNYIFTLNADLIPFELVPSYNRQWYHYQVSNKWCPQYFSVRNEKPDVAQILSMYCFLYAVHKKQEDYLPEVEALFRLFPDASVKHTVDALYQGAM